MIYQLHRPTKQHRRISLWLALAGLLCSLAAAGIGQFASAEDAPVHRAFIHEIKSGGGTPELKEYVTIYNASDQTISLTGWRVEYAKSSFSNQHCGLTNWKSSGGGSYVTFAAPADLAAVTIGSHQVSAPIALSINDSDPGSIHLVDNHENIQDTVGWGTTGAPGPCFETAQAAKLSSGRSLQRYLGCTSGLPVDSNDNSSDFWLQDVASTTSPITIKPPQCTPPSDPDTTPATSCQGVTISEILPNPAGSDTGHEFIELHNPTNEAIDLRSCSLQTSASNSKIYDLGTLTMQSGDYLSLSDTTTGLSLTNSSSGAVWLVNQTEELQVVTYPADMEDDTSWALADGWATTYTPTPGAANIATPLKPCNDGLIRNSETNRCITPATEETTASVTEVTAAAAGLTPCKAGQERNPETNRCRNITGAASAGSQTACKEGQERNPETNRCRNVATAAESKACPAGQERNPETNRCRKVTAAGSNGSGISGVQDIASDSVSGSKKPYVLIAIAALGVIIAYGVYEWRQEIIGAARRLTKRPVLGPQAVSTASKS